MTDIREFLRAAAPLPAQPVDAAALVRGASRRSWHRWVTWVGGVLVAVGATAGGSQLVPAGDGGVDVRAAVTTSTTAAPVAGPTTTSTTTTWRVAPPPTARPTAATSGAGTTPASTLVVPPVSAPPGAGSANLLEVQPDSGQESESPDSRMEGCDLDYDEYGPCSYVATRPAGAGSSWLRWHVRIERGSQVIELDASTHPEWCVPEGTILAGDRVTAWKDRDPSAFGAPRGRLSVGPGRRSC